jgi:hypothetical protein
VLNELPVALGLILVEDECTDIVGFLYEGPLRYELLTGMVLGDGKDYL